MKSDKIIRLLSIALIYVGIMLMIFPSVIFGVNMFEFIYEFSKIFIYIGILLALYYGIVRKMNSISDNISACKEIELEQLLPYDYAVLERIIPENECIKIAINSYTLENFGVILKSVIIKRNSIFKILIMGQTGSINSLIIDEFKKDSRYNDNVEIKFLEDSRMDNVIILNKKTYALNYSDSYKSMFYISVFDKLSAYSYKNRKLFEELWNGIEEV